MRAAVYYGREDVRIEDVPDPQTGPGQVKVRVAYNGICGTDLHEYYTGPHLIPHGTPHPRTGAIAPLVIGHEFSGEVVELGEGVERVAIGDRVSVEPIHACGTCRLCRRGAYNLCIHIAIQGADALGGGMAEYAVAREERIHQLPEGVGLDLGALVEPLAVSYHAVCRVGLEPEMTVAVYGGGPIGVGAFLALRARGIRNLVVIEPSRQRADVLRGLGAETVIDPTVDDPIARLAAMTDGYGADVSFDTAGVQASFDAAVRGTSKQGTVVLVATYGAPVSFQPNDLVLSERTMVSSCAYRGDDFEAVIATIADGGYPTDGWVSTIGLDDVVDEGFAALHEQRAMKVLVDVRR